MTVFNQIRCCVGFRNSSFKHDSVRHQTESLCPQSMFADDTVLGTYISPPEICLKIHHPCPTVRYVSSLEDIHLGVSSSCTGS